MLIDSKLKTPLYLQLYESYKKLIVDGELKSGDKLPSKRQLSNSLGLSLNTITKAYYLLEEEGFIKAIERSGYFVEEIDNTYIQASQVDFSYEKKEEKKILYDFSSSSIAYDQFPFYTFSKLYKDVIANSGANILMNSEANGKFEFRCAISKYLLNSRGLSINPENIVVSSGMEYLFEILFYLFSNENIFGLENPGYDILPSMISSRGYKYESLDIKKDGLDVKALKNSKANILCITPSHQFPTGRIMPINRRLDILKWASESPENYIIEDDYDSEFKYVGKPLNPLKNLDTEDKVIYMGSFSKSIAPSLRTSYMILPSALIEVLKKDAPFFICSVPVIDQMVLTEFLDKGHFERHLNKMRRTYKRRRERMIEELSKYPKVKKISGADSGIHIVVEFNTSKTDLEIKEMAVEKGIKIQALSEFYNHGEKSKSKFILGFGAITKGKLYTGIKGLIDII